MGGTFYSSEKRSFRANSAGYYTKKADDIFTQNKVRRIHESMEPSKAIIRESRDSQNHPLSIPIIMALDVTGSMGHIPHYLVKDGLPKIMSGIIQKGVSDPQILFLAIGDHECDSHPLQVGQFESGDEELDLWLTRTYIESGGGGNSGESYLLAWYFAANHTVTDAWEKRKQKGFLFTIGDEPCLRTLPNSVVNEIMGTKPQASYSDKELLKLAQEKYNVYHLQIMEGSAGKRSLGFWKELLGDHCIEVKEHMDVSKIVVDVVTSNVDKNQYNLIVDSTTTKPTTNGSSEEIYL
jgi:hypothetical protein